MPPKRVLSSPSKDPKPTTAPRAARKAGETVQTATSDTSAQVIDVEDTEGSEADKEDNTDKAASKAKGNSKARGKEKSKEMRLARSADGRNDASRKAKRAVELQTGVRLHPRSIATMEAYVSMTDDEIIKVARENNCFRPTLPIEIQALREISKDGLSMIKDGILKDEFPYELETMVNTYLTDEIIADQDKRAAQAEIERAAQAEIDNDGWSTVSDDEL